jgi:putative lipoic acid-binding regulatory protein
MDKKISAMASYAMADIFQGQKLEYPVSFDLRTIYVLAEGATIREDLERILAARGVKWTLMQGDTKSGAKYGRFGVRLTMESREQMYGTYEDIGKLPYIKTAL